MTRSLHYEDGALLQIVADLYVQQDGKKKSVDKAIRDAIELGPTYGLWPEWSSVDVNYATRKLRGKYSSSRASLEAEARKHKGKGPRLPTLLAFEPVDPRARRQAECDATEDLAQRLRSSARWLNMLAGLAENQMQKGIVNRDLVRHAELVCGMIDADLISHGELPLELHELPTKTAKKRS